MEWSSILQSALILWTCPFEEGSWGGRMLAVKVFASSIDMYVMGMAAGVTVSV